MEGITKNFAIFTAGLLFLFFMIGLTSQGFAQASTFTANEIRSFQSSFVPDRGVILSWSGRYNDTTSHIVIERSIDALNFEVIGELAANNTKTEHRFIDRNPVKDVAYYRLHVMDYDGNSFTSALISSYIPSLGKPELLLYPMPIGNAQTLNLNFQGVSQSFKALVTITDQNGRQVLKKEVDISDFNPESQLDLSGNLPAGNYQISVLAHSGNSFRIGKLLQIVQ